MKRPHAIAFVAVGVSLCPVSGYSASPSTEGESAQALPELIVTAQKREESINDVPIAIAALTAEDLRTRNVAEPADLARVVPGFNVQESIYGAPVFYIRGVGFSDPSPTVTPAVTVYTDQVALPYSVMAKGASLDLERVEILKGPQGTLFGQNATGGAVNYVAAKPTDHFESAASVGFGRFSAADVSAYVSGPITDTIAARFAASYESQGNWQYSATRPSDKRGQKDFLNSRLTLAAKPIDALSLTLTASLWRDQSDTNAAQLALVAPQIPFPPIIAGLQAAGYTPTNARVADWDPGSPKKRDDRLYQISLRGDYTMGGGVQLTSITAYSNMQMRRDPADVDATAFPNGFVYSDAAINVFSQELRVSGAAKQWHWMLGGSYQRTNSTTSSNANLNSTNALGLYDQAAEPDNQAIGTSAAFGSLEFLATDAIRARASVRYTKDNNTHQGCLADGGNGKLAFAFGQLIFPALGGVPTNIPPGGCVTLDDATKRVITPMPTQLLDESNVSWRVGLDWKPAPGALLYASIAKGYKAGAFAQIPSVFESQQQPVTQESVLDYEIGLKMDLLDRRAHIDFSTFYYDYKNKQLQGYVNIPPFGALPTLVNIPSSRVIGAEATLTANLTNNLRVQLAGTVLDTKVQKNPSNPLDPFGAPTSFIGESFPNTPKYQANADIEQTFPISGNANIFLGGDIRYRSSASGAFGSTSSARASEVTTLVSYGLVDVRAGLRLAHPDFSVELWGDNLTNKYYYVSTLQYIDTLVRYAGQPRSYGIRLRYQF